MNFILGSATPIISPDNQTALTQIMQQLSTDLGTWFTQTLPILGSIVGVFILVWLVKLGLRIVKSLASSTSK